MKLKTNHKYKTRAGKIVVITSINKKNNLANGFFEHWLEERPDTVLSWLIDGSWWTFGKSPQDILECIGESEIIYKVTKRNGLKRFIKVSTTMGVI